MISISVVLSFELLELYLSLKNLSSMGVQFHCGKMFLSIKAEEFVVIKVSV